ncbi:MAG: LacI family DNA-binding transcriptional regulator [Thermomicrobiales bacterium]
MSTIHDVARAAGVSPMTVSRVFRGAAYVRAETRQRVLDAAAELNYVPNAVARSLRQARSGLLAFIIPDIKNPLFYAMARGAEDAAHAAQMAIVLGNSEDEPAMEARYLQAMAEHRVDGILLVPTATTTAADMPILPAGVELVLLDRRPPGVDATLVSCDIATATRDLCRHLMGLGHRRIALVGGIPEVQTWRDRVTGYQHALQEAGLVFDPNLVTTGNFRAEAGVEGVRSLMRLPEPPDVIVAASTQVLNGVLDELAVLGLTNPGDIAVCCVDDPGLPAFFRPRLTHVVQPGYDMGAEAVRLLLQGIQDGRLPPADKVFPAQLKIGESCGERVPQPCDALLAQ